MLSCKYYSATFTGKFSKELLYDHITRKHPDAIINRGQVERIIPYPTRRITNESRGSALCLGEKV